MYDSGADAYIPRLYLDRQTRRIWPNGASSLDLYVETEYTYLVWRMSNFLQRLKKIEVVEDDEADIIDAVRRLSTNYDFVVTRQVFQPSQAIG